MSFYSTFCKTVSTTCFFVFAFFASSAQETLPEVGRFTNEEWNLKECSFDKDADAVVLLDHAVAYFNGDHNLITERRIRLKILKEKGIERGNIHIPYYSADDFEYIRGISAVVISPAANNSFTTTELESKNIFSRQVNSLYSEMTFALPNVKVGSIIDYSYRSVAKNYAALRRWDFQSDLPVATSWYELSPLSNSEFAYSVYKNQEMPIQIKQDNANGKVRFVMNNVPGLRDEVYSASTDKFLQHVNFQMASYIDYTGKRDVTSTWPKLSFELMEQPEFGGQTRKDLSGSEVLKSLSPALSPTAKLKAIYNYVGSNITWNHIISKYSEDGVKDILSKKTGNSGDINLLLVALLKSAGLDAYPLLVSERSNGLIDTTYSYKAQFNKVVAFVSCEGKEYVLDGTDGTTPFFMVPPRLLNTIAYLVDRKKSRFVYFNNLPMQQREFISLTQTVNDDGTVTARATVTESEYAKLQKENRFRNELPRYKEDLLKPYPYLNVDSFSVTGLKNDSVSLKQGIQFHYDLKKTGSYYLLNPSLFTGLNENPFVTLYRFTDIDFGTRYSLVLTGSILLPETLTNEPLPANKRMVSPDHAMGVSRILEVHDKQINLRYTVDINRERFAAAEYEDVKAFFKEMVDLLNEPILLKTN